MPLASIRNLTSMRASPATIGGMPFRSKRASERQSFASSRSPCTTWMATFVCPSTPVVKCWVALAATVEQNPGQITILALGPMTNVAMLLRLHPDLEGKIKRIVFMGGNVHVPGNASAAAEFNFWFDPEAAQAVLRSRILEKVMFPLDICNRAVLTKARFDEIIAAKTPVTERYKEDYGLRYPGFAKNPNATGLDR